MAEAAMALWLAEHGDVRQRSVDVLIHLALVAERRG
jgi:hypothetical protein